MPLDRPGVRIARLAESITILKGLFAPGPFTFHGEHYRVTELDGMPKPPQGADLPFLDRRRRQEDPRARGARGEDRRHQREPASRARARRPRPCSRCCPPRPTRSSRGCATPRATASTTSRSRRCSASCTSPTTRRASRRRWPARSACRRPTRCSRRATLVGSVDGIVEILEQRRERWQMSYIVVPIESTETLAPVVARLAGN